MGVHVYKNWVQTQNWMHTYRKLGAASGVSKYISTYNIHKLDEHLQKIECKHTKNGCKHIKIWVHTYQNLGATYSKLGAHLRKNRCKPVKKWVQTIKSCAHTYEKLDAPKFIFKLDASAGVSKKRNMNLPRPAAHQFA